MDQSNTAGHKQTESTGGYIICDKFLTKAYMRNSALLDRFYQALLLVVFCFKR